MLNTFRTVLNRLKSPIKISYFHKPFRTALNYISSNINNLFRIVLNNNIFLILLSNYINMKKLLPILILLILSCSNNESEQVVNMYSQRHYDVDQKQYDNFEEKTGIKVNVIKANADELIQRIKSEGENSPADLFITVDVGKLWQAADMGLLQKYDDKNLTDGIPESLIDKNGFWVPVTYRSRVLVYSNERVKKSELSTYEDLANPKWKGRLLVRSSSNSYNQALMSSLVANLGEDATKSGQNQLSQILQEIQKEMIVTKLRQLLLVKEMLQLLTHNT